MLPWIGQWRDAKALISAKVLLCGDTQPEPKFSMWPPAYSTDWAQGGPLLDKYNVDVWSVVTNLCWGRLSRPILIHDVQRYCSQKGQNRLVAGMRCIVASRLGHVVDVPEELL